MNHITFIKKIITYFYLYNFYVFDDIMFKEKSHKFFLYWVVALGLVEMRSLDSGVGGVVEESFKYDKRFTS